MQDISVIMLTFNEERHIRRALTNARKFAKDIFVVDCFSTDRTCEIAEEMGAHVYRHEWENHSKQLAWALKNLPLRTEWIWRQDADEYLTDELIDEIEQTLPKTDDSVGGYTAPCLRKFMGRYIKHGIVPLILLRLVRTRCARVENKMMDEHMQVTEGSVKGLKNAFFDDSLMTLTEWTQKHNGYATREAADLLCTEYGVGIDTKATAASGAHTASVRAKKLKYTKLPLFWRAFAFFVYRYFFRLGFLDGKEGFLWHFLQGFWYRSLADAKVFELKKRFGFDEEKIKQYLIDTYMDGNKMGGVNRLPQRARIVRLVDETTNFTNYTNEACAFVCIRTQNTQKARKVRLFGEVVCETTNFTNYTNGLTPQSKVLSKCDSLNSCDSWLTKKDSWLSVADERRAYAA